MVLKIPANFTHLILMWLSDCVLLLQLCNDCIVAIVCVMDVCVSDDGVCLCRSPTIMAHSSLSCLSIIE